MDGWKVLRLMLAALGGATIAAALTFHRAAEAGQDGAGRIPLLLTSFGVLLILVGWLGSRIVPVYRAAAIVVLNTVVLLAALELAAAVLLQRRSKPNIPQDLFGQGAGGTPVQSGREAQLPYYRAQPWGAQYWRELPMVAARYHPYVAWRRAPFAGQTITVDEGGYRTTPGADCHPGSYKVFALGGSTMWGYGSPDWATIPAYLQAGLSKRLARPVCVVNLGELGFNSTQDLIELITQLQAGNVPDLAIFYQGINDVWTAYQNGRPGAHFYLEEMSWKLERGQEATPRLPLLASSSLVRLLTGSREQQRRVRIASSPDSLAEQTSRLYLNTYQIAAALARAYGFEYQVFWQPNVIVDPKPLTPVEAAFKAHELEAGPAWTSMMNRVYSEIERAAPNDEHLHYMATIFEHDSASLYADWAHLTPAGDRLVAQRMLDVIGDPTHSRRRVPIPPTTARGSARVTDAGVEHGGSKQRVDERRGRGLGQHQNQPQEQ